MSEYLSTPTYLGCVASLANSPRDAAESEDMFRSDHKASALVGSGIGTPCKLVETGYEIRQSFLHSGMYLLPFSICLQPHIPIPLDNSPSL
jgi:hypothetical protein